MERPALGAAIISTINAFLSLALFIEIIPLILSDFHIEKMKNKQIKNEKIGKEKNIFAEQEL